MPHEPRPFIAALALTACFADSPDTDGDDTTDGASSSSSSSSSSPSTSTDASETLPTDPSSESDSGDASSESGGPADGYPDEVLMVLDLPFPPRDYTPDLPPHFLVPAVEALDNTPADNPITDDGATLGLVLFHDVTLSSNETIACASCHQQPEGFSDPAALSTGFAGGLTARNSMPSVDGRFYANGHFFWDERAATLEEQVLMPIQNEVEMGLTLDELVLRVAAQPYYPFLFERAFGDAEVSADRIAAALAQYVRATVSYRSRYDDGLVAAGSILEDFPTFTAEENLGKNIFLGPGGACAPCHLGNVGAPPMPGTPPGNQAVFSMVAPANNGLDAVTDVDPGVMTTTGNPADDGRFKAPSLRNVALTGPYMHDGRFETLAEVIEHYDSGVEDHPNLDPRLRGPDGLPRRLELTLPEKAALIAFLETLNDDEILVDEKFRDPFFP